MLVPSLVVKEGDLEMLRCGNSDKQKLVKR